MHSYLWFYIIAGLLLVTEAFSPGMFIFVCFAIATAITGVVDQLSNFNFATLLGIDLALSLLVLFTVRPLLKLVVKIPKEAPGEYGSYAERLIGKEAMVFKAITSHEAGVVKLLDFDEQWLARSEDSSEIGQGTAVTIKSLQGNFLIVKAKA